MAEAGLSWGDERVRMGGRAALSSLEMELNAWANDGSEWTAALLCVCGGMAGQSACSFVQLGVVESGGDMQPGERVRVLSNIKPPRVSARFLEVLWMQYRTQAVALDTGNRLSLRQTVRSAVGASCGRGRDEGAAAPTRTLRPVQTLASDPVDQLAVSHQQPGLIFSKRL